MDVGVVTGQTFDIDSVGETNAVLIKNNGQNRWLYKNEKDELVILEKTEILPEIIPIGTLLKISEIPGYAHPVVDHNLTGEICGKLGVQVDWDNLNAYHTKNISVDGFTRTCALLPVILY